MQLCLNDLLYAFSDGLDFVEQELVGNANFHGKRVAYLCIEMGKAMGLSVEELLDLAACGILHDNALTEYIQWEYKQNQRDVLENKKELRLEHHCIFGEQNIKNLPFFTDVSGAILYHHENADGTGPLGKKQEETPLFAQLIHLADILDVGWNFGKWNPEKHQQFVDRLEQCRGNLFSEECITQFCKVFSCERLISLEGDRVDSLLQQALPKVVRELAPEQVIPIGDFFGKIVDYKSSSTGIHCRGLAEKMKKMAEFYGSDEETAAKAYLTGAVHDVGKLLTPSSILEKNGKLTSHEYSDIQDHAYATYKMLSRIGGLEEINSWASNHHEKLNGKGYPFGKTAEQLGKMERLTACMDIYQALTEPRPYKEGFSHGRSIEILQTMVAKGELDGGIVNDIDHVFAPAHV